MLMRIHSTTEILDIAAVDIFSSLSKEFVQSFPEHIMPKGFRDEGLDVEFHWVTEHGQDGKLTAGGVVKASVSPGNQFFMLTFPLT